MGGVSRGSSGMEDKSCPIATLNGTAMYGVVVRHFSKWEKVGPIVLLVINIAPEILL